jgi:hypothetical protein
VVLISCIPASATASQRGLNRFESVSNSSNIVFTPNNEAPSAPYPCEAKIIFLFPSNRFSISLTPRKCFQYQIVSHSRRVYSDALSTKASAKSRRQKSLSKKSQLEQEGIWKFQPQYREDLKAIGFDPARSVAAEGLATETVVVADAASYRPSGPDRHHIVSDMSQKEAWQYPTVPNGFWKNLENQRRYFDWLGKRIGVENMQDWYKVQKAHFRENSGAGLLASHYNDSIRDALKTVYPEHEWFPWMFSHVSRGYFAKVDHQRAYMEWLAKKLNIVSMEQWYTVKQSDFAKFHGKALLATQFGGNVERAVRAVFPAHEWHSWLFRQVPDGYWDDIGNQRLFFDWLGKKIGVTSLAEWANVRPQVIISSGGWRVFGTIYGRGLKRALSAIYPEHDWSSVQFQRESAK